MHPDVYEALGPDVVTLFISIMCKGEKVQMPTHDCWRSWRFDADKAAVKLIKISPMYIYEIIDA